MITLPQLTEFFGWAAILNIGLLVLTTLSIVLMKQTISALHSKLFGLNKEELPQVYFDYLARYKALSLVFSVVPYLSLKLMGL
ncbi:MAG: hypothetical protein ACI9J2_002352 [Saprospiraceae bacterium]|jgi:hypothetical protein